MADKRRGRRPLDPKTPSVDVHLTLTVPDYDQAERRRRPGEFVQDVIRRGLKRLLADEPESRNLK